MPASIIFENTISHVVSKDQDNEMPLHHGVHSPTNRHHQSMVHYRLCLVRPWTTVVTQKTPLSHWRWSFHANTNEVHSLIFKTTGVLLTNKEEQLSTTPLDNQGSVWVACPMNTNSSTKNKQKSRKVYGRRAWNCPYPHLQDRGLIQGKVLLNGLWALANR